MSMRAEAFPLTHTQSLVQVLVRGSILHPDCMAASGEENEPQASNYYLSHGSVPFDLRVNLNRIDTLTRVIPATKLGNAHCLPNTIAGPESGGVRQHQRRAIASSSGLAVVLQEPA